MITVIGLELGQAGIRRARTVGGGKLPIGMGIAIGSLWLLLIAGSAAAQTTTQAAQTQPVDSLAEIENTLQLDETAKLAMAQVQSDVVPWDEPAFFMLLNRAEKLPKLLEAEVNELDLPAYRSLMRNPQRYSFQPLRVSVRVIRVKKLASGDEWGSSPYWPKGKNVWRVYCTNSLAERPQDQPIVLYCVSLPMDLGKPSEVTPDGEQTYSRGPEVQAACVFYKLFQEKQAKPGEAGEFPILVAWQIGKPMRVPEMPTGSAMSLGFMAVAGMAVAYFLLRRSLQRTGKASPSEEQRLRRYASRRDSALKDRPGPDQNEADTPPSQAEEDHSKERSKPDGTSSQG